MVKQSEVTGHNFLSGNKQVAINGRGTVLSVGDAVTHEGSDTPGEVGIIKSFEWNEEYGEVKAHTDKGHGHIDFMSHVKEA
jgi:hypothetical protein